MRPFCSFPYSVFVYKPLVSFTFVSDQTSIETNDYLHTFAFNHYLQQAYSKQAYSVNTMKNMCIQPNKNPMKQ